MGPLLFLIYIYIYDLDDSICSKVLKFADDTKVFSVVSNANDTDRLQQDLRNLCNWSQDWQMLFNVDKCKIMHIGYNNGKAKYEMNGKYLEGVIEERDLGVIMQSDLKCSSQCIKAVNTANRVLGMIKRTFSVRDKDFILLFCSYISHWLDHIWSTVSRHGGHIFRKK